VKKNLQKGVRRALSGVFVAFFLLSFGSASAHAREQTISERVMHYRAIDAVVWAMPLLNFKTARDGHAAIGAGYNDIAYHSRIQDWKFQAATPNDTTPYVNFFWNVKDGPVVIEIPPSGDGVGIFGTLIDAWQRPLEDVGAAGKDKGRGGKYLVLPPGYDGELLPGAYTIPQKTYNGFAVLRPIIADTSPQSIARATAFAKKIKIYPLSQIDNPPENRYVDIYGKAMEGIIKLDGSVYSELNDIIQEEVVEEKNMAMMGMLSRIGIRKGEPFRPDDAMKKVYASASADAHEFMIEQYHRVLNPFVYKGKRWSTLTPPGVAETGFTWEFPSLFDYNARGVLYYAIITSVKNYGAATYYLDLAEDEDGNWLDGGRNYKLNVPPNVPVRDFWSATVYDLESAAWIRGMPKLGIASSTEGIVTNRDGSVDIFFGAEAPDGLESNWIPTRKGRRFFLLFRFYGPEAGVFDGSFELNSMETLD
jgi:hypothetical protein